MEATSLITPEVIQAFLALLSLILGGGLLNENSKKKAAESEATAVKEENEKIVRYVDPADEYNEPPESVKPGTVEIVSQDNYSYLTSVFPVGKKTADGVVIGHTKVKLFKYESTGIENASDPYAILEDGKAPEVIIKLTPLTTGNIVVGYQLDEKGIKTLGQKGVTTINSDELPDVEYMTTRYSDYTSDMHGEHTITIWQGYQSGKTAIGGDQVVWFDHTSFPVIFQDAKTE